MSEHVHHHEHPHTHAHAEVASMSKEEVLAMLTYMLDHNRHHAEEIHEIAHNTDGAAAELLHSAMDAFSVGNDKLEEALRILKGE